MLKISPGLLSLRGHIYMCVFSRTRPYLNIKQFGTLENINMKLLDSLYFKFLDNSIVYVRKTNIIFRLFLSFFGIYLFYVTKSNIYTT